MKDLSIDEGNNRDSVYTRFICSGEERTYLKGGQVLGIVRLCGRDDNLAESVDTSDVPYLTVGQAEQPERRSLEMWISSRAVSYRRLGNFRFSYDGTNLFGSTVLRTGDNGKSLDMVTKERYLELFRHINQLGYPHLYRIWNYIPRINDQVGGLERYRAFCLGRNLAFDQTFEGFTSVLPAATGIATSTTDAIQICFLAHKYRQGIHIENPRQTPAYRYPKTYGPKPPSFARATYMPRGIDRYELYVSGTASIIGSQSMWPGDVRKQCYTALGNIELLIGPDNLAKYDIDHSLGLEDMDCLKIHYRKKSDLPIVQEICESRLSPLSQKVYIHGDICRSELLVEIEGSIQSGKDIIGREVCP